MTKAPSPADLRVVSLFSGIGGLDLGFARHGVTSSAYLEVDRACCETIDANRHLLGWHDEDIRPTDITTSEPRTFCDGRVDLIIGGPPCQSFSAAGRRAGGVTGTDDARGSLFWHYCRYVESFQPKAFLFENVRGIVSSRGGNDWAVIKHAFRNIGYRLFWRILNAADYGTPQSRERLFLVGIRSDVDLDFRFPRPTHGPDSAAGAPYVTAGAALADLDDPSDQVPPYGGKYGDLLPAIPPGENYRFYTEELGHPNPLFAWRSKFSGFLYKLSPDEVSRTIVAEQGRYDGPFHWRNRKCTVAELKRLQGFPDDFRLPQRTARAIKQVGNSVAPPVATALANALLQQLGYRVADPIQLLADGDALTFDHRKRERARRSRAKRSVVRLTPGQAELFQDAPVGGAAAHRGRGQRIAFGRTFRERQDVADGIGVIDITGASRTPPLMTFTLTFAGKVADRIRRLSCSIDEIGLEAYYVCWQSIHDLVGQVTSFPSLAPLYGHFTEPYPKFSLSVELAGSGLAADFITTISNFEFTAATHDVAVLQRMGIDDPAGFLKAARRYGIDARTHHTNRTIAVDRFRICYPFAIPSSERQFVVWTDDGDRKKHDLRHPALAK